MHTSSFDSTLIPSADSSVAAAPDAPLAPFCRHVLATLAWPGPPDFGGLALTEQFARDPRSVQDVDDHAEVIDRLLRAGDVDTLFDIVASGLLHGLALRMYRTAIALWLGR